MFHVICHIRVNLFIILDLLCALFNLNLIIEEPKMNLSEA